MTTKKLIVLVGILACLISQMALAASSSPSKDAGPLGRVLYLDQESAGLKRAAGNAGFPPAALHYWDATLWQKIPRRETTAGAVRFNYHSWEKPSWAVDPKSETRNGNPDELMSAFRKTLRIKDVPLPWEEDLYQTYLAGETIRHQGLMRLDKTQGKPERLGEGQLGAYFYTAVRPIEIVFNKVVPIIARYIGDDFTAAIAVHEGGHARDDADGRLNPKTIEANEERAYKTQYRYLKVKDPKGEVLSWLRVNFGKGAPGVPKIVSEYLEHVAMVISFGDKGDWAGLVKALGYKDPHSRFVEDAGTGT